MKRFKNYFFAAICVLGFSLYSCSDDDEMTLTIEASGYDVVKDLKNIDGEYHFTGKLPDDIRMRMHFFVYRSTTSLSGDEYLVASDVVLVDDVKAMVRFSAELPEAGYYKAYTVCDLVKVNNNGNIATEYNSVKAETGRTLVRVSKINYGKQHNAFGKKYSDFDFEGSTTITMNPQPAGGLITLYFKNIDVEKTPKFFYYIDGEKYGSYNVETGGTGSSDHTNFDLEPEPDMNYWHQLYCTPSVDSQVYWGYTGRGSGEKLPITPGKNQYVEIDLTAWKATIYNEIP